MRYELRPRRADRGRNAALAELAEQQHGVVARRQLLALGFSGGGIVRAVGSARLHPIHRGVYAVGHARLSGHGHHLAAVLACGSRALLSHLSAAWLWDLLAAGPTRPEVTAPHRGHRRRSIRVHHSTCLGAADAASHEGIPVTSVARTLLDVAGVLSPPRLERALEQAERLQRLDLHRLQETMSGCLGHRGVRRLGAALDLYREPVATRSELERAFLDLIRSAGLARPSVNVQVAGHEVDFLWRDEGIAVELDGFEFHGTRAAFERDRARDHDLQMEGIQVVRLTWRRLQDEGAEVAERLGAGLRQRRLERQRRNR